ncbi:MAG TPA: hypothetical protein VNA30_07590 [Mycobacteriales bacterium]|nr:hypothetical protein [Mycobacteriales bacterium]
MFTLKRRWRVLLLVPVLTLLAVPAATSAERTAARLTTGSSAFWTSAQKLDQRISVPCGSNCQDFALELAGPGARLRVAADGDGTSSPTLLIFDDRQQQVAKASGIFSVEVLVPDPKPGRYVVRVEYSRASTPFRLRARLERTVPAAPTGKTPLLPNLRLVPPYEFTMDATAAGQDLGCNAYERAEYGARRCLRFSLGPANAGRGPLILEFPAMSGFVTAAPVVQIVENADGSVTRRQAGSSLYHKTHAHHHHNGFGSLELYRVTDTRRGTLVPAGTGPKQGFCMLDFMIADWRSFANDPAGKQKQGCDLVNGPTATKIALGTGWADIYYYALDGNYVEFGSNPDGNYVVRSVADAQGDVLESDESDNAGYAYVEVRANQVRVLERGHGNGPWDPRKRRADDLLRPTLRAE